MVINSAGAKACLLQPAPVCWRYGKSVRFAAAKRRELARLCHALPAASAKRTRVGVYGSCRRVRRQRRRFASSGNGGTGNGCSNTRYAAAEACAKMRVKQKSLAAAARGTVLAFAVFFRAI
ncbi:hypothetical protein NPIL_586081 [Nephila pilipes]|uniref:Uncharacterized protein n=1 Tax=Nephila pilipes TaxID=299642 RepID=A0A8X6P7N7_NEPPI|nr:hypothetical protein NPIL_586081 [Nephila pilipes]